jgi:hypothetical protein
MNTQSNRAADLPAINPSEQVDHWHSNHIFNLLGLATVTPANGSHPKNATCRIFTAPPAAACMPLYPH